MFVPYINQSDKSYESNTGRAITGTYAANAVPTAGANITKYGIASGLQSGKVSSTSAAINVGGVGFSDQVQMNITQKPGDSGGPVVFNHIGPVPDGKTNPSTLIGIATFTVDGSWNVAWASKAANINSAFGLSTHIKP